MASIARRLAWIAIGGLFVLLFCHPWFGPDIWYHLFLGGRILHTGSPQPADHLLLRQPAYVNTYWLFQVAARSLYALGGLTAVNFLFLALWTAALGLWLADTGLSRAGAWAPLAGLAAVLLCQTRFEERPEVVSYLCLALQIHWLLRWPPDRAPTAREWFRFLAVQALWTNAHGYFVLGPCLVGARWAGALGGEKLARPAVKSLALLLSLTLLATLASPFGLRNWEEIAVLGRFFQKMHGSIQEFLPPARVPAHVLGIEIFEVLWWAFLAGLIFLAATDARRQVFALILGAAGLFLGMTAVRNLPLFLFLAAPGLAALVPVLARRRPPALPTFLAVAAAAAVLAVNVVTARFYRGTGGVPGFGWGESRYGCPVLFTRYLGASPFRGRIFNDPGDGGYLEFHLPDLRLYADTRFVAPGPVERYFSALVRPAALERLDRELAFDAVLLRVADSPYVVAHWLRQPGWALAYADLHRAFLVNRGTPPGRQAILISPHFYSGEDLAVPVNGSSATAWAGILVLAGDRDRLRLLLRQCAAAPAVPTGLLKFAREYGQGHSDPEIADFAARLAAKALP